MLLFTDRDAGLIGAWSESSGLTVLAEDQPSPRGIVARGDQVWWSDNDLGVLFGWSPGTTVATPAIAGLTNPADLAWIDEDWLVADRGANRILRVEANSAREPVVDATPEPYFLTHDGAELWWGDFAGGTLRRATLAGSPPETWVTDQGAIRGVALADGHVYWTDRARGTLSKAPTTGTPTVTLVYADLGTPHGLIHVDGMLWWADPGSGRIFRAPTDGSSDPEVVIDGLVGPWDLTWRP